MTGFRVVIADGPAAGWEYVTSVVPDPRIAVAPNPARDPSAPLGRRWMRVLVDEPEWPGQAFYERVFEADPRGPSDEVRCEYREAV